MTTFHELSAVAKDAFVLLQGATEIRYRDGDTWKLEEGQKEHPVVNRLRAASLSSMTSDPPEPATDFDREMAQNLKNERFANQNMSQFLVDLEDLCHRAGMPKTVIGREVLTWLEKRLAGTTE